MSRPGARSLLSAACRGGFGTALEAVATEGSKQRANLYLVGGCVRDLILGRGLADLDLVVEGAPDRIVHAAARRMGARAHGPSPFGTWRVDGPGGLRVDIAMARRESYAAPAALPRVSPAPIEEDLLRRDFTVNAMALGLTGPHRELLLDPAGGSADLGRGVLRLLHRESLVDDPTRAFRAARYAARYSFRLGRDWPRAMSAALRRGAFRRLTAGRLRRELELAWKEERPQDVLSRAARLGLLKRINASAAWSPALRRAFARAAEARRGSPEESLELFFALFLRSAPSRARPGLLRRLGITGRPAGRILEASRSPERACRLPGSGSRRGAERFLEEISGWDSLSLECALLAGPGHLRRRLERMAGAWESARPLLTAEKLISMGVPRGPRVGALLHRIRVGRAAGTIRTLEDEEALVRRPVHSRRS